MKQTLEMYCVLNPKKQAIIHTLSDCEPDSVYKFMRNNIGSWDEMTVKGYRCIKVRVEITEIEK